MRYRILIQNRSKNDEYVASIPFEAKEKDINTIIEKIKKPIRKEISKREQLLMEFLQRKKKGFIKSLIDEIPDDLIDWKSKGKDISKEEFLENEMWFDRYT